MNLGWIRNVTTCQPLTFRGVAAFAPAPFMRLWFVYVTVALLVAAATVWFVDRAWSPVILEAIQHMPERGQVRSGQLNWPESRPALLAEGRFLAIIVDLDHRGEVRAPAHIQLELGRSTIRWISLLGYVDVPYPGNDRVIAANRIELEPWWGAWRPPILWMTFGAITLLMLGTWCGLSMLAAIPAWVAAFLLNRELSLRGSVKLSGAALMPGALVMTLALIVYGFGAIDLVQLLVAQVIHLLIDLVYLVGGLARLARVTTAADGGNPFKTGDASSSADGGAGSRDKNPFR